MSADYSLPISRARPGSSPTLCLCRSLPGPDCAGLNSVLAFECLQDMPCLSRQTQELVSFRCPHSCACLLDTSSLPRLYYNCCLYFPCCLGSSMGNVQCWTHRMSAQVPAHGGGLNKDFMNETVCLMGGDVQARVEMMIPGLPGRFVTSSSGGVCGHLSKDWASKSNPL